jgi:WXXGXW repeat (2 copies)
MTIRWRASAVAIAAVACGARFPHPSYTPHTTAELVEVPFPPPPARVETVPDRPSPGALWIDGEWAWRGRKWSWRTGYWATPTAPETYSPWQLTRDDAGTLYIAPGTWRDARGQAVEPPPPARLAGARSQTVVDAEGISEPSGANLAPDGGRARRGDGGA